MNDTVHLIGAEDVRNAASSMRQSAETMKQAASEITSALHQHQQFLRDLFEEYKRDLDDRGVGE